MRRIIAAALGAILLLNIAGILYVTDAAYRYQTNEPSELVTYAGIVRRDNKADRWHFVAAPNADKSGHTLVGFATVTCNWVSGALHVRAPFLAVAGAVTQPDETLVFRGVDAGPSIGNDDMRIYFAQNGKRVRKGCADPITYGPTANVWVAMFVTP